MLRHLGAKRTYAHNVKLAGLLSVIAGFVNAAGFLAFAVLTTNVTGHAALFAEGIALQQWHTVQIIALWMFLFLADAFLSSYIISRVGRNQQYSYLLPITIELAILITVALLGSTYDGIVAKKVFAGSLLFAMGLQNSLVTIISGSVVRTTHLTGTFTDLGIEIAQFIQKKEDRAALTSKIKLHFTIIFCFLLGALAGAYIFKQHGYPAFFVPFALLCYALLYDILRVKLKFYRRHLTQRHNN